MVQMRTWWTVADNSGARQITCILPLGGDAGLTAGLGDVITAAVKEASPDGQVKKGKVVRAVVVRTRKEQRRKDGTYIRFDDNARRLPARLRPGGLHPTAPRKEAVPGRVRVSRGPPAVPRPRPRHEKPGDQGTGRQIGRAHV